MEQLDIERFKVVNSEEKETIDVISRENTKIFELADSLIEFGFEFITNKKIKGIGGDSEKVAKGIVLALYTKAFKTFRSIIVLCKYGLGQDGQGLTRVFFDAIVMAVYLLECQDIVGEAKRIMNTNVFYDKKMLNGIKNCKMFKSWTEQESYKSMVKEMEANYYELCKEIKENTEKELKTSISMEELSREFKDYFIFAKETADKCGDATLRDCRNVIAPISSGIIHGRDFGKHIHAKNILNDYGLFLLVSSKNIKYVLHTTLLVFIRMIEIVKLLPRLKSGASFISIISSGFPPYPHVDFVYIF